MDVTAPELLTASEDEGLPEDAAGPCAPVPDLLQLRREADALLAAIRAEQAALEAQSAAGLGEHVLPLSLQDLAPDRLRLESMKRQQRRFHRESVYLRRHGAELLALCREALQTCSHTRQHAFRTLAAHQAPCGPRAPPWSGASAWNSTSAAGTLAPPSPSRPRPRLRQTTRQGTPCPYVPASLPASVP